MCPKLLTAMNRLFIDLRLRPPQQIFLVEDFLHMGFCVELHIALPL